MAWTCLARLALPPGIGGAGFHRNSARRSPGLIARSARSRRFRCRLRNGRGPTRSRLDQVGRGARHYPATFPTLFSDRRHNNDRCRAGRLRGSRSGRRDLEDRHRNLGRRAGGAVGDDAMPTGPQVGIMRHGEADLGRPVDVGCARFPQDRPRLAEQAHLYRRAPRKAGRRHHDDRPSRTDGRIEVQCGRHLSTSATFLTFAWGTVMARESWHCGTTAAGANRPAPKPIGVTAARSVPCLHGR
jgi:hypothetical protein